MGELDFDLFMLSTATAAVVAGRLGLDPKHVLAPSTYQRDETEELVEQANVAPISHAWHQSECEACAWHPSEELAFAIVDGVGAEDQAGSLVGRARPLHPLHSTESSLFYPVHQSHPAQ